MWHRKTPEFPFECCAKEPFKCFLSCVGQRTITPVSQHYWCHRISVLLVTTHRAASKVTSSIKHKHGESKMPHGVGCQIYAKCCPLFVWDYSTGSSAEQASCERQLNSPARRAERLWDGSVPQPVRQRQSWSEGSWAACSQHSKWHCRDPLPLKDAFKILKKKKTDIIGISSELLVISSLIPPPNVSGWWWRHFINGLSSERIARPRNHLCNVSIMQNAPLNRFIISWKHPVVILLRLNKGIVPIRGYVLTRWGRKRTRRVLLTPNSKISINSTICWTTLAPKC